MFESIFAQPKLIYRMHSVFKNALFVFVLTISMSIHANVAKKGESKTSDDKVKTNTEEEKVNYKDVKDVFRRVKRVDDLFSPKKKLRKKKYIIA